MHNQDDKYPARQGFEPGTPRLQAPVDTNEPSGPAPNNSNERAKKKDCACHLRVEIIVVLC